MSTIDPNQPCPPVEWGAGCAAPHDTSSGSHRDRLTRLARKASNAVWERRLGVDTRGMKATDKDDGVFYAALSYRQTRRMLRELALTSADTFVDIGCGKGRVTTMAARYTPARVVGVEYDPELSRIADANAVKLHLEDRVRICCVAAEDFDYTGMNVFFMFTPFGAATLDKVLGKIYADVNGPCRVVFLNCTDFHLDVFRRHTWLREVRTVWDGPMRCITLEG